MFYIFKLSPLNDVSIIIGENFEIVIICLYYVRVDIWSGKISNCLNRLNVLSYHEIHRQEVFFSTHAKWGSLWLCPNILWRDHNFFFRIQIFLLRRLDWCGHFRLYWSALEEELCIKVWGKYLKFKSPKIDISVSNIQIIIRIHEWSNGQLVYHPVS